MAAPEAWPEGEDSANLVTAVETPEAGSNEREVVLTTETAKGGLCSHSAFDPPEAACKACGFPGWGKKALPPSHGLPGGAACCGHSDGLASCPRSWA